MAQFGFSAGTFQLIAPNLYRINLRQGFQNSRFSTSLEKLVFEVIYCLLSPLGSIPTDTEFGTLLKPAIGRYASNDGAQVQDFVLNEFNRAEALVKARQADANLPLDQKLSSLNIDMVEADPINQSVNINFVIVSQSGQQAGFVLPVSVT